MALNINFFDNYMLMAAVKEIVPKKSFFKDRYFPTTAADVFKSKKVLLEYQDGDRKMAAFVAPRVGDIPVARQSYKVFEYEPPRIAPSRILTIDDLTERGFGEALYPGDDEATRAAKLQAGDMNYLDKRIARLEEYMCVQTMINNGCTVQEYIDASTQGESKSILFYDTTSNHTYTVGDEWDDTNGDFFGDVEAMCLMLSERGLPAADLILGTTAASAVCGLQEFRDRLNKHSGFNIGELDASLTEYPGVSLMGRLNFNGFMLNVISVNETYVDASGNTQKYFPAKSAMVTAPGCGALKYGSVTQINYGDENFSTHAMTRVPKLIVDQENDIRKIRLTARPIAMPRNYCPFIYAANVVQ